MKKLLALSIALTMCWHIGCAPRERPSRDYTPSWDSSVPSDYVPEVRSPIEIEKIPGILSENESGFHFRETRWGFSPERVKLAEEGKRPEESTRELLVYRHKIKGINCKLIYTFKDNKLRTAGYMTTQPIRDAADIIKEVVDRHGVPTINSEDGMTWKNEDFVIWTNTYVSVIKDSLTNKRYTNGGLLSNILRDELLQREKAGKIVYFDGVIGYIDREFYNELLIMRSPLRELSSYEQQLMGVLERSGRRIIPGLGSIPN